MILIALVGLLAFLASSVAQTGGDILVEDKYSCPHGWTRYGTKKCLKYVNELQDYERAQATCRSKNHGTLVTIHSHDEQNFVYSYIHSIAASSTPIWLGAKQIDFESILWLDKTENSYTNWAPSEPSHPDEICIAINPRNGMWHDVMCTEANVPACERAPTTQWPFFVAFCSEGWFQFNDEKCVRIISSQALNFYESQELCRSKYNSKLLSIKSDRESEFLHNLIKFRDVKLPVWLGAVQNDFSSFNWIDKSDVTFTNWAEGEPNDPDHACLSMTASGGKWSDNDCKEQKLILCQKAVPEDSSCETGWLQFRQDKCYRFVHIRLAFDDAESLCNNLYGGHLPSIHSQEEQFMISQFLASVNVKNGSEIWLGGRQMDFHNFNWGDGSLFNYSYWEHGEPNFPAEKCIEMSWRNGRWNDINCRLKRAVLCERQVSSRGLSKPSPNHLNYQPISCLESNCTTSLASTPNAPSNQIGGEFVLPNTDFSSQPAASSAQLDGAGSNNSTLANANNRTLAAQSEDGPMMLPPDDKPIKVITSIMHREHPTIDPTFVALANASGESVAGPNASFIHYSLPPPSLSKGAEQLPPLSSKSSSPEINLQPPTASAPVATPAEKVKEPPTLVDTQAAPSALSSGNSAQQQLPDSSSSAASSGSLMEKLKSAGISSATPAAISAPSAPVAAASGTSVGLQSQASSSLLSKEQPLPSADQTSELLPKLATVNNSSTEPRSPLAASAADKTSQENQEKGKN